MEQLEPIKSKIYELSGCPSGTVKEDGTRLLFQIGIANNNENRSGDILISQTVTSNHAEIQESGIWKSQFATSKPEVGYAAIQRRDQKQASVASDALAGGGNRRYTAI